MADNDVTQDQLEQGNDPAFGPALEARGEAEQHESTADTLSRIGSRCSQPGTRKSTRRDRAGLRRNARRAPRSDRSGCR